MADNASRRGAVDPGTLLMVLAFVVIAGFLWWLYGQAEAERAAAAMVEDSVPEEVTSTIRTVGPDELRMDATAFEGQEIRVASMNIASLLGTQGFWLEIPNGNPFLVSMSPEVMAEGLSVAAGSRATVTGTVLAMNDSTLTAWSEAGTIQEGDRIVAEFATHYMEATEVAISAGGGGSGSGGS